MRYVVISTAYIEDGRVYLYKSNGLCCTGRLHEGCFMTYEQALEFIKWANLTFATITSEDELEIMEVMEK